VLIAGVGSLRLSGSAITLIAMGVKPPLWRRLVESAGSLDAAELAQEADESKAHPCGGLRRGEKTEIQGRLRHVVYTPRDSLPTVEAELFDGTGSIELVWLGRRRIKGIEPGRMVRVQGRVGEHDGHPAIYNPRYELRSPS
jgi:RecJ-like exonuclease